MYNYQTYLKENKLQKKFQQIRKEYYEDIQKNQKSNPSLIHSHKKRIEGFILAMIEKPNPVRVYEDQHYEPRSPEKSHSIHQRSFHLNHTTDKERIEEASEKNSVYDAVPFNNTFSHRFRDLGNSSNLKPMRYKPFTSSLRVKEELQSSTLNYLPNFRSRRVDKLLKNPNLSLKDKGLVKQINKSLLPLMHKKTYYQSLKSIFAESPHGFMKNNLKVEKYEKDSQLNSNKLQDYDDESDLDMNARKQKKNSGQNMNRKQNSRQALIKCGLLGSKPNAYVIGMEKTSKKIFPQSKTENIRA